MHASLMGREVSITVRDYGRWRDSRAANRGHGLRLIETFMDSVTVVTSPQEGTEVRMARMLGRSRDGRA
jgi:anti-sigma regulatory factor (Ser/Thr protein kinase)